MEPASFPTVDVPLELLRALRACPLDVHQLAADLVTAARVIEAQLQVSADLGLAEVAALDGGRMIWDLTAAGRGCLRAADASPAPKAEPNDEPPH